MEFKQDSTVYMIAPIDIETGRYTRPVAQRYRQTAV